MKCPQCHHSQKFKDGMTCNACGRPFALNPKQKPFLTDMAFGKIMDRLSGFGHYHFTRNQLFSQIVRFIRKKQKTGRILFFIGSCLILAAVFLYFFIVPFVPILMIGGFFGVILVLSSLSRRVSISAKLIDDIIDTYQAIHPIDLMVDGRRFEGSKDGYMDEEMTQYAPEQILIVERNDLADMLILNRFHFENKTLVLSAEKYPAHAFDAFKNFMAGHPDIPVCLMHDASIKGRGMRERLLSDPSWGLKPENVKDLGLFPEDTKRLEQPIWLPHPSKSKSDTILLSKNSEKKISNGYRMPVDVAPPRPMMSTLGPAVIGGMALLSGELLFALQQDAAGAEARGGWEGGFG